MESKTCTKCNIEQPLTNYHIERMKKDGSLTYASRCQKCKYNYNIEYLKKKRQEPEFKEKERKYLQGYSSGVRQAHLKNNWEALRPTTTPQS